jgi:hypothetical protein
MNDYDIQKQWMLEIGRRLRDGETGVRLKDVMEATGVSVPSAIDRDRLWKEVWYHIEAMGLVVRVHHSSREPSLVDSVTLTDFGSDPANWDD